MTTQERDIDAEISALERQVESPTFWNDKRIAQETIKRIQELKNEKEGVAKYDKGNAILTILSGAGGDDAEDFSRMLLGMYLAFFSRKGFSPTIIHQNENDHGGFRNITVGVSGKNAYGTLKRESGVHRLVRISPFNAKQLRHTSFSLVEVVPEIPDVDKNIEIRPEDIRIEFARSSGPGGQNVNKRETAVRIVHIATNLSAHADGERSQAQNKDRALQILKGKLFKLREEEHKKISEGMQLGKTTDIEWGNQIRSYVLHPYKMVKDHRTDVEVRDVEKVLEGGEIDAFIEAEQKL